MVWDRWQCSVFFNNYCSDGYDLIEDDGLNTVNKFKTKTPMFLDAKIINNQLIKQHVCISRGNGLPHHQLNLSEFTHGNMLSMKLPPMSGSSGRRESSAAASMPCPSPPSPGPC